MDRFPLSLLGLSALLALIAATVRLPSETGGEMEERRVETNPPLISGAFWIFAAIAVLYAFAEGTFSNWAVIYLREAKDLSAVVAALALSVFWGAMVVGRLLVAVLVVRIAPLTIWLALPVLMIAAFLLLPGASNASAGSGVVRVGGFGLLGVFSADHHPGVAAIPRTCRLGLVHAHRRADGGGGTGFVRDRPLREWLSLEQIYQFSVAHPVAVIGLALWLAVHGGGWRSRFESEAGGLPAARATPSKNSKPLKNAVGEPASSLHRDRLFS